MKKSIGQIRKWNYQKNITNLGSLIIVRSFIDGHRKPVNISGSTKFNILIIWQHLNFLMEVAKTFYTILCKPWLINYYIIRPLPFLEWFTIISDNANSDTEIK